MNIRPILGALYWALRRISKKSDSLSRLLQNAYLAYGIKRDALLKLMKSQLASGDVVYDIGAYNGLYSIVLAKKTDAFSIYSFEPNPQSYARLNENIKLMRLGERIIPKNIALGSDIGKHTFYVSSARARSSFHKYNAEYDGNKIIDTVIVDCFTIDYLVEHQICSAPDLMKIDTEGHEYEVLLGARNTIESKLPQIFLEPHHKDDKHRIKNFLSQFGYEFQDIGYPIKDRRGVCGMVQCADHCHSIEQPRDEGQRVKITLNEYEMGLAFTVITAPPFYSLL